MLDAGRSSVWYLVFFLAACGGQEGGASGPPQPLDTRPVAAVTSDPGEAVVSGNTRAAADIAAIAALGADFDPQRDAEADLATAQVEAQRGGRRIIVELGDGSCQACTALDAWIEGEGEVRRARDAGFVWLRIDRSAPANAPLLARWPGAVDAPAPHLLLLDAHGRFLQAQAGADLLPKGRPDARRIRGLLEQWAQPVTPQAP